MRRRRKFLSYSLLFLLLLTGTLFLVYKFIIPVLIEQALEDRLSRGLGKEVRLEKVDLDLFRRIKFYRLFIYEPGEEKKTFLQIEELQIDYCHSEVLDNLWEKGKNFRKWQLALKVTSPEIIFRGWRLENFYLPLRVESSRIFGEDLEVELYGGSLKGSFGLNLVPDQKDYQFEGTLSDLDLSRLAEEWGAQKEKELRGTMKANFHLQVTAGDWKNFSGQSEVSIVEGNLGELPLLGGLMVILPLLSRERVVFREGRASFTIQEGVVATENLTLTSDQANLLVQGKMDWQGYFRPSLTCKIFFSRGFIDELPLLGNIISSLLDEAGHLMAQVEVTGSLREPKYRVVPLAKGLRDIMRMFSAPPGDGD